MGRNRTGRVFLDRRLAGRLQETDEGMTFTYDPAWLSAEGRQPISLTLPLRSEPYECRGVHPFFLGLLPEGWLLGIALSKLKLASDDVFGLLLALCRDCVGAVHIEPSTEEAHDA